MVGAVFRSKRRSATMPLRLNVGLNRKVGEVNYSSRGASVNLELELDGALVAEPQKLHERIRQLFGLVRTALAEELNGGSNGHDSANNGANARPDNGQRNDDGNGDSHSRDAGQ